MNRKEKIDAIYEKIADKTLSFGCKVFHKVGIKKGFEGKIILYDSKKFDSHFYGVLLKNTSNLTWLQEKEMIIIGHPVMIGDVLEELYGDVRFSDFAGIWRELRKPIEEQSDECVDFVYELIFK